MHRKFIALICSMALVITATTTQARSNEMDVAKVLGGLAALAIVGTVIKDRNDRKKERRRQATVQPLPPTPQITPRPLPTDVARFTLPRQCLRNVDNGWETTRIMGRKCLRKNFSYFDLLPENCRVRLNDGHKVRNGYRPKCLRRQGYALSQY